MPTVTLADFALIYGYNVYQAFKNVEDIASWWDSTGDFEMSILWYQVYLDICSFDPSYDIKNQDATLAIIGFDKKNRDIHIYTQDRTGNYKHIDLFNAIKSSDEMIYEIDGVSLTQAKERMKKLTDVQYELTYDVLLTNLNGE